MTNNNSNIGHIYKDVNYDKHIWEGWRVSDFIMELQPQLDQMYANWQYVFNDKPFMTKEELRNWCKDNQPYYKKHIPDVVKHFIKRYNIKK